MSLDHEHTRYYSARPRRVPPELCTDELLEECSPLAALALYRIISQADDQGRLPGSPKHIRALCFGMRPEASLKKVASAIEELVATGFLIRYVVAGRTLLQVDRWLDLQGKWGRHAYPSRYPAPPGWNGDWVSVKGSFEASELRAVDEPEESDLHTPISIAPTVATASPSTVAPPVSFPSTGVSSPARGTRGWESPGDVLRTMPERGLAPIASQVGQPPMPRRAVR
ncbi:MAG: hypothetical protein ABSD62_13495 [Candidatus Limnocylindrales bacterium]